VSSPAPGVIERAMPVAEVARRLLLAGSTALCLLAATMAWDSAGASAAITHKYATSITEGEPFEPLASPGGVAADSSGNVFLADAEGHAVDVFSAANAFVTHIGAGELTSGFDRDVAVSGATGEVYVANSEPDELQVFRPKVLGEPAKGYEALKSWEGETTKEKSFGGSCCFVHAAVNNSGDAHAGDVYVLTSRSTGEPNLFVLKPGPSGEEVETVQELTVPTVPGTGGEEGLAVSPITGEVYVATAEGGQGEPARVRVFNVEGVEQPLLEPKGLEVPVIGSLGKPIDVAVDPSSGNVYVVDAAHQIVDEFNPAGRYIGQINHAEPEPGKPEPLASPTAVAVSSAGEVYVSETGRKAIDVFGSDEDELIAPSIKGETATGLTATEATLQATITPNGLAGRFATSYHFEYGTSAYGTSVPVPEAHIGAGRGDVAVSTHLTGLAPNTTYHWRLVATNENGTTTGLDHTFIYDETGGGLPDNRSYEMVTPPEKNGALIGDNFRGPPPVISEDGSRVVLGSVQCFGGAESCPAVRRVIGSPYEFTRGGGGWTATALAPPATEFATNSWWFFSADAGTALFTAPTAPHGEDDWYARQSDGSLVHVGPFTPPAAGQDHAAEERSTLGSTATADLSHIVWGSNPVWPGSASEEGGSLYEYTPASNTQPVLVGVSGHGPANTDLISRCVTDLAGQQDNALSGDGRVVYFRAKPEGTSTACLGTGANESLEVPFAELYARVDGGEPEARTVPISEPKAPETLASAPPDEACTQAECIEDITNQANWRNATFWGASGDGSKAFFTSSQRLTDAASQDPNPNDTGGRQGGCETVAGASGCNLYEYEGATTRAGGHLVDISSGDTSGHGPRVQGVTAISLDGSHVYFVAKSVLSTVANSQGELAHDEQNNLYVYTAGHVTFIATLPASDLEFDWEIVASVPNVTPDGRFLVFTSSGALTPDMTRGDGARQVFRYDAQTGRLLRISIGARGFNDNGNGGSGDASIVAAFHGYQRAGTGRPDPTMSNDGSYVFFMSPVALTPGALKSVQVGTCTEAVISEAGGCILGTPFLAQNIYEYHEGTVSLISDGHDTAVEENASCPGSFSAACLIGTDETGSNVFFSTADRLSRQDTDTQLDFYDARICTAGDPCIQPPPPTTPPCHDDACHGTPPATPSLLTPGSASFNGAGNVAPPPPSSKKPLTKAQKLSKALKACRQFKKKSKRAACERVARRRYGPSKAKKASAKQGAK
jgi:DNA-binding beta-propeller fold protein YncE